MSTSDILALYTLYVKVSGWSHIEKLLLTERETEYVLNLSRSSIRRLMAQGELRPLKISRSIRFVAADVASYIERLKKSQHGEDDGC